MSPLQLKNRMRELGIEPKKSLGQNFLIGDIVVNRIVDRVRRCQPPGIIEIGPGLGALTERLVEFPVPLRVIEFDRKLSSYWRQRGLVVSEADALKLDWSTLELPQGTILVSNLPYQISSSLVIERSLNPCGVEEMLLMFQKEVAQRIVAKAACKDYGFLSVIPQLCWEIELVLEAAPNEFYPSPKVASRVLYFRRRKDLPKNLHKLTEFVKAAFAQRRKYLYKNLAALGWLADKGGLDRVKSSMREMEIREDARAEQLSPSDFVKLFEKVSG